MTQQQIGFDDFKKALFSKDSAFKSYRTVDLKKMYDNKHPLSFPVISASSPPEGEPCYLMIDGKEDGPYTAEQIRGIRPA
ncbi:MAG: hypothetical protein ABR955_05005 [Verrucomicrobiota bacterium]|jgi:hypothetical protein